MPVTYCFDDCSFVVESEIRKPDSYSSAFLYQVSFGYLGVFCVSIQTLSFGFFFCLSSLKNAIGNLIWIALNLYIALGCINIFTILIFPIQEHGISFQLFGLSSISLISQCLTVF